MNHRTVTVTRPNAAMREAMASAVVGDDVLREDPTINALEDRCARLFGTEAALYTPTASMANLIAVMLHCENWGSEFICGTRQHIFKYERGTYAHIAKASCYGLPNLADGTMAMDAIKNAIRNRYDIHQPRTRLICIENTHNVCGGLVLPKQFTKELRALANEHDMKIHLDGSRLYNAAVSSGCEVSELCADVDSVTMCLSKGIGAPTGAVLGGTRHFVEEARKLRKSLGGGMRQVGVLAAAAMYGLDTADERMKQDHINAKRLSSALNERNLPLKCQVPQTNIMFMDTGKVDASVLEGKLKQTGVLCFALSNDSIRFVTHSDITADDIEYAIESITDCVKAL